MCMRAWKGRGVVWWWWWVLYGRDGGRLHGSDFNLPFLAAPPDGLCGRPCFGGFCCSLRWGWWCDCDSSFESSTTDDDSSDDDGDVVDDDSVDGALPLTTLLLLLSSLVPTGSLPDDLDVSVVPDDGADFLLELLSVTSMFRPRCLPPFFAVPAAAAAPVPAFFRALFSPPRWCA